MADEYIRLDGKKAAVAGVKEDAPEKEEFIKLTRPAPFQSGVAKFNEKAAPFVGRAAVEGLPFAGSFYGPLGTLAGTFAKTLIKSFAPNTFGKAPASVGDLAADTGKELLLNNALPKAITGLGKMSLMRDFSELGPKAATASRLKDFPAVRERAVREMTEQILGKTRPESSIVETGAGMAERNFDKLKSEVEYQKLIHPLEEPKPYNDIVKSPSKPEWHPDVKLAMDELGNVFGENKIGNMLVKMSREVAAGTEVARTQGYKEISNLTLKDLIHVQNAKLAAGPHFTNEIATRRLLDTGFSGSTDTLSANKILAELKGKNSEIYREAMYPKTYDRFLRFMEDLQGIEKKNATGRLLTYANNRLVWAGIGAAEMFGLHGVGPIAGSVIITDKILSKWMSNPETAALVTKALQTPHAAPEAGIITKALARSLQIGADLATVPEQ